MLLLVRDCCRWCDCVDVVGVCVDVVEGFLLLRDCCRWCGCVDVVDGVTVVVESVFVLVLLFVGSGVNIVVVVGCRDGGVFLYN